MTYAAVVRLLSVDQLTLLVWCVPPAWQLTKDSARVDWRTPQTY